MPLLTSVTDSSGNAATYGYDALYRLTSEAKTGTTAYTGSYAYDLAGNATSINGAAYTYTDDLISAFSYDADGNPTSGSLGGISTSLTWNDNDKLVSLTNANSLTESNVYGADGLRYAASVTVGSTTLTRYFVYANGTLIGEVSANGTPIAAYTWGNGLVSERRFDTSSPTSSWYLYGAQGETRALTASTGAVTDTYAYSAYGNLVASTGSTTNPFRYGGAAGYYTDSATGVVLCGQRWYAPGYGRWLNADPIGYDGGANRYVYCGDDPVGGIDPSGECVDLLPPHQPPTLGNTLLQAGNNFLYHIGSGVRNWVNNNWDFNFTSNDWQDIGNSQQTFGGYAMAGGAIFGGAGYYTGNPFLLGTGAYLGIMGGVDYTVGGVVKGLSGGKW